MKRELLSEVLFVFMYKICRKYHCGTCISDWCSWEMEYPVNPLPRYQHPGQTACVRVWWERFYILCLHHLNWCSHGWLRTLAYFLAPVLIGWVGMRSFLLMPMRCDNDGSSRLLSSQAGQCVFVYVSSAD